MFFLTFLFSSAKCFCPHVPVQVHCQSSPFSPNPFSPNQTSPDHFSSSSCPLKISRKYPANLKEKCADVQIICHHDQLFPNIPKKMSLTTQMGEEEHYELAVGYGNVLQVTLHCRNGHFWTRNGEKLRVPQIKCTLF